MSLRDRPGAVINAIMRRDPWRWGLGLVASVAIAGAGYRRGSLSRSGAMASVATGTLVTGRAGIGPAALIVAFFATSSALSRLGGRSADFSTVVEKGERRDARQVAANGLVATVMAMRSSTSVPARFGLLGAVSAVTGDTWSTEFGSHSHRSPRLILSGRVVPPGTSGGITALGLAGAIAGGGLIGLATALTRSVDPAFRGQSFARLLVSATVCGLAGSLVDSLLGATIQERRRCAACGQATERVTCHCGAPTTQVGGIGGVDNDLVNLLSSAAGAAVGWSLSPSSTSATHHNS